MDESLVPDAVAGMYRIEEHVPGRRLVLVWQGRAPGAAVRMAALAAVLLIVGAATWFARAQVLPVVQRVGAQPGGDDIGLVILGSLLCLGGLVVAYYLARETGRHTAYVSRATFDATEQTWQFVQSGWLLLTRKGRRGKLSAISMLDMTVGAELPRGALPVALACTCVGQEIEEFKLSGSIAGVETRAAALDLFCDLARIADFARYVVQRNDPRSLRVNVIHRIDQDEIPGPLDDDLDEELDEEHEDGEQEEDGDDPGETGASGGNLLRVPIASSATPIFAVPAGGSGDAAGPALEHRFQEPPEPIPAVDFDALSNPQSEARLIEWDLPRRVHTHRDAVPRSIVIVAAVGAAILGALLGAWPLHGMAETVAAAPPTRWETGLLGAIVAAVVGGFLVWALNRPREVTIDLIAGTIYCRQGEQLRTYSTDQVCEVALVGEKDRRPAADKPGVEAMQYRCRVELGVDQTDEWVFDSADWNPSQTVAYVRTLPLAIELARALNVPFRWQSFDQPSKPAWHRRLGWKERAVLAAVVLSMVGYLANQGLRKNAARELAESMRTGGAEVSFMNGYSIQEHLVLADYWQVTLKGDQFDADKLRGMVEGLQQLDRVGLVLEDTPLNDAAMPVIGSVTNLLMLDANSTNITSDGLAALAGLDQLVFLSVANTIVGDAALERLPPLASLKFLNLSTTNVTDEGVVLLAKFPSLSYVMLYNLQLSDAAIDRLRAARPDIEIRR